LYFAADDGVDGSELWVTDGTPAGTQFFKDLVPGAGGSNPHSFVLFNDAIYFFAGDGLWKSDGTVNGTVKVKTVVGNNFVVVGSRLFFAGYTTDTGYEPWVSDGTEAGTHLILDIAPGTAQSMLYGITPFGDRILFPAYDPSHGNELWISDGTASGTHIVRDIWPGLNGSMESGFISVNGNIAFFIASTPEAGQEVWKTDGTEAGTALVIDLVPGQGSASPGDLTMLGGNLYFTTGPPGGSRTLRVTDGTAGGTRLVKTSASLSIVNGGYTRALTNIDGTLFFAGANLLNGYELWKSDGTDAGTVMVANIAPDVSPSSNPSSLTAAGDWIYFNAWDGSGAFNPNSTSENAGTLWRSDGTPEGTVKVVDSFAINLVPSGHTLFFTNYSANSATWTSDGTPEGTMAATAFLARFPATATVAGVAGDKIFVNVGGSFTSALWATTTAPNAPALALGCPTGSTFTDVAGRVMFFSTGLWSTDGTPGGTLSVRPDFGGSGGGGTFLSSSPVVMGGALYFFMGATLYRSDGTYDGTVVVKSFTSNVGAMAVAGRNIFFLGSKGQLWVSDGTEAGTRTLPATATAPIAAVGERVVFSATDTTYGVEPWVSDGTPDGTHLLLDVVPGTGNSYPYNFASAGGSVYFLDYDNQHGGEPWVTDGTPEGTHRVADLEPGIGSSNPGQFLQAGNRVFFTATTSANGTELWALPLSPAPGLTVDDVRVTEGDSGTKTARFTVTLSPPSTQTVTVDYATGDGTAAAGSDYDAVSGTLTFAPGEASKSIDVTVRGDVAPENNETFYLNLRNAVHAALTRSSASAIIDDDDQFADVAPGLDFSSFANSAVTLTANNNGPRTATNLKFVKTATPTDGSTTCQSLCSTLAPAQLAPGASFRMFDYRWIAAQQYVTLTLTAQQPDPQPSNNSVGWIMAGDVAMEALYLAPGADAKIWLHDYASSPVVSLSSSNPAVLSVPASVAIPAGKSVSSFPVHGVSPGTATLRVFNSARTIGTISVDVVAPGTKMRWPAGLSILPKNIQPVRFDQQEGVTIYAHGSTAPYNGQQPTGDVRITANGQELGRTAIPTGVNSRDLFVYSPVVGPLPVKIEYLGDDNFLPMSIDATFVTLAGNVSITSSAERSGTTATIHLRLTGSPMADPGGTLTISEAGVIPSKQVTLTAAGGGVGQASVTLTNLSPGIHTLSVVYSGDGHYNAQSQPVRLLDARRHAVAH
jgi:ELWxxDGT repeat protein